MRADPPERGCDPPDADTCIDIPQNDLTTDDGATCTFTGDRP